MILLRNSQGDHCCYVLLVLSFLNSLLPGLNHLAVYQIFRRIYNHQIFLRKHLEEPPHYSDLSCPVSTGTKYAFFAFTFRVFPA